MIDTKRNPKTEQQLQDYLAQALVTADPKAFQHPYLIPGIVGEVGELHGQTAKAVWHGWDDAKLSKELISEYGDIAWMTAVLLHVEADKGAEITIPVFSTRLEDDALHLLLMRATSLNLYYSGGLLQYIPEAASRLWSALEYKCKEVTGVSFQEVLDNNIAKLADRAARGVLKGAGDNR